MPSRSANGLRRRGHIQRGGGYTELHFRASLPVHIGAILNPAQAYGDWQAVQLRARESNQSVPVWSMAVLVQDMDVEVALARKRGIGSHSTLEQRRAIAVTVALLSMLSLLARR